MIFASVGSMLPFERFVRAVDAWAGANPGTEVFIQTGDHQYAPVHARFASMIPIDEYRQRLRDCDLFVAHVGMGSIMQALEERKQTLMMPRHASLGEHTTDHQLHTAERFGHLPGLRIVDTAEDLQHNMTALLQTPMVVGPAISQQASPALIDGVRRFLQSASA